MQKLRWGILGTGMISRRLAKALQTSQTGTLLAVASRGEEKAKEFAAEFSVAKAYASYDELLADPEVDAVYVAVPHPDHAKWTIRTARAKKHILCEKPAGMNAAEVGAMIDAARENGVFFLEAFMYRCHPQTAKLVEVIRRGAIGEVRLISCDFGFNAGYDASSRIFARALGGGGILDVGCYAASMARLIAGAAVGQDFADPVEVKGLGHLDAGEGTDLVAVATLKFASGIVAQLSTAVQASLENKVRVTGSKGTVTVTEPWFAGNKGARILIHRTETGETEEINTESDIDLYHYELDLVAAHSARGQAPAPAMSWADSLGNAGTLDAWRAEAGVVYAADRIAEVVHPLWADQLNVRADARVASGVLPGMTKPMTKLVIGGMAANTVAGQIVLDDYFERGGNAFDTAYVYGPADAALGHWVTSRGVREEVVLIAKGAHTPDCTPEGILWQLDASLQALQTNYADLYIMHRDNADVPVGEFVTVLNDQLKAGKFQAFGCSNWTLERLIEANDYAKQHGLVGFSILNNQLSLARMIDPVWADCLSVSDAASRAWLTENQFPMLAWSSQARGFFTPSAHPEKLANEEIVRCWYSDDNFKRKQRAAELSRERGVEEINIALAYVLSQPLPIWSLIGPATVGEVRSCFSALDISLTPDELRWLNLEQDSR